ncbi:pyridoxamine 5'-phosphate oxidase family protein [Longitalea arenae]|uniref:pyridoxamine 5'-phosphate oxidase family protein n=1 Tax=Longitalea arenae TaxID=2812558 RepID=UPI0019679F38|nr:pyridoxamine 5'-phosphate oxidase family protein [Longitalea arenae]
MKAANSIPFLQDKIQGIGSALFYNLSGGVLKFPTTIVSIITVDELANIWFFTNRPEQQLNEFDRQFPAHMQFYRKGKGYYLQIVGKAYIINDPEELNSLIGLSEEVKAKAFKEMVLIKFKIGSAKYYTFQPKFTYKHNVFGWLNRFYNWFFKEPARTEPYVFRPMPQLGF